MTPTEADARGFRAQAEADGYTVVEKRMAPGTVNPDHSHPFDARLLITDGEISVSVDGETTTCRAGDVFELDANRTHSEVIGPEGVCYLAARR